MAGDNTFEKQMLDFYGKELDNHLFSFYSDLLNTDDQKSKITFSLLTFLIAIKKAGFRFSDIQNECHKMQHELYNQLERDRNNVNR